jgi:Concanavalin A-like lectin/glucanases superfamily
LLTRARNAVLAIPLVIATIAAPAGVAAEPVRPSQASTAGQAGSSHYVRVVRQDRPTALLQRTRDLMGGRRGAVVGAPKAARLPNGDPALDFNGRGQFARFADRSAFEVSRRGVLTVEYWMRPDALQFSDEEGSGYVYVLGKGDPSRHEYYGRMYSKSNSESRPNRISGYSFNPQGGLGAGSYFQDSVTAGQWIHVALVINAKDTSSKYPMGYTKIYKNGVLRDTDSLAGYDITPRSSSAPFRVGTGYLNSFFEGAVGNVAFYNKELTAARLQAHTAAMR